MYLQSLGIESKGEIARILDIAMNPNSLFFTLRDKKRAINIHVRIAPALTLCSAISTSFITFMLTATNEYNMCLRHSWERLH